MNLFIGTGNKGKLNEFRNKLAFNAQVLGFNDIHTNIPYQEPQEDSEYFIANGFIKLLSTLKYLTINCHDQTNIQSIHKVLVDDSGLCIPKLNYEPGVHSAHYAGKPKNDDNNNQFLMQKLIDAAGTKDEEVRFPAFFLCFLFSVSIQSWKDLEFISHLPLKTALELVPRGSEQEKNIQKLEFELYSHVDLHKIGEAKKISLCLSQIFPEFSNPLTIQLDYGYCSGEVSNKWQQLLPEAGHGYDPLFYPNKHPNLSFASIELSEKNKFSHRAFALNSFSN